MSRSLAAGLAFTALASGCPAPNEWQTVAADLDEALMSVGGTSEHDVWAVGSDKGQGPVVLHFDGTRVKRLDTGHRGDLWWVQAFAPGHLMMAGASATVLEYKDGAFTRHLTPGLARQTVFGLWGRSATDVYAVGSSTAGRSGFIWRYDGSAWKAEPLPDDLPRRGSELPGFFKVWGTASELWVVGSDGVVLRREGDGPWQRLDSGTSETLFTVAGDGASIYAVGGGASAVLLSGSREGLTSSPPDNLGLLQGVASSRSLTIATGEGGAVFEKRGASWTRLQTGRPAVESLHAVWLDPSGGIWTVGGNVLSDLTKGAFFHASPLKRPTYSAPVKPLPQQPTCPPGEVDPQPTASVARRWDEALMAAIRRDLPRPTVHARNLFHFSAAMWDAFAAYDASARGVFTTEKVMGGTDAQRDEAISYAAFRVLEHRYRKAVGGPVSLACFSELLTKQGYDPNDTALTGSSPRALGNRIAKAIIDAHVDDGSNERNNYSDTTGFRAVNSALSVESPSKTPPTDIDQWQPLDLAVANTQNGIPLVSGVQGYIGAQWRDVRPFALTRSAPNGLYVDPGMPPRITSATLKWAVDIVRKSAQLTPDTVIRDFSPGAYGNNPLGTNDGSGHLQNPVTGQPYAAVRIPAGDFFRVLAEFWADGPKSETPPGHWNVLANQASDHPMFSRRWKGQGAELSKLAWDVRLYLALNGAVHDAAIAAWEVKRAFTSSRPITIIRSAAALGQSTDPSGPSYHPAGLPLEPGLIEVITDESSRPGERHAHLRGFVGELVPPRRVYDHKHSARSSLRWGR